MNIKIEIHYKADSKLMQRASLPLRGRKPERVAYEFWKSIKKGMPYPVELEEVLAANEDITELVKELERQELLSVMNDDLPLESYSNNYEDKVKQELEKVLGEIQGVGNVSVMIHFDSGNEYIPAFNQNNSTKVTEESDNDGGKRLTKEDDNSTSIVTTNESGNNKPFIVKELKPKISGVIVIAEGAENPDVKYRLYEAVKTVFGIEQYKVNIYPMGKK
jgi:stage III sporulation protein AG